MNLNELLANPSKARSYGIYQFSNLATAKEFSYRGDKLMVVLGECGRYYVATMRLAQQMVNAGYEWAE